LFLGTLQAYSIRHISLCQQGLSLRKSIGIVSYAVVKISQIRNIMSEEAKSVETQSVLHDKADCGQKASAHEFAVLNMFCSKDGHPVVELPFR
jgi:hypothetical protein